jgi:hypothetical protein
MEVVDAAKRAFVGAQRLRLRRARALQLELAYVRHQALGNGF